MMRLAVDVATPSGIDRTAVEHALGVAATDLRVHLVGDAELLREHIDGRPAAAQQDALRIVPATDAIPAEVDAGLAVRGRAGASVRVAMDLVRRGEADAVVSVSPGPVVAAAAAFVLGRLRGHRRTTLAARVNGVTVVDAGASTSATTSDLAAAATAVAVPGARIGLLLPVAVAGAVLQEFRELVAAHARDTADGHLADRVVAVDVAATLDRQVDVVACPGALGATLVDTARRFDPASVAALQTVVGVPAAVAALRGVGSAAALRNLVVGSVTGSRRGVA